MFSQRTLVLATVVLVGLTALIHLLLGLHGVGTWMMTGELSSVLAPLFLLSGIAILVGIGAVYEGILTPRPAYALGAGMMVMYLIGYLDWHVFGYAETVLELDGSGHTHDHGHDHGDHEGHANAHDDQHDSDYSTLRAILDHLGSDRVAIVCKTSESIAAGLLAALAITTEGE